MRTYTLTETQLNQLADALDALLRDEMFYAGDEEVARMLRDKLRRVRPNPGMRYANLYVSYDEEPILRALFEALWRR